MESISIQDIKNLDAGDKVERIQATIKSSFPASKGQSGRGKWKVQAAVLEDDTGEIRASFWNLFDDDLSNYEGRQVAVSGDVSAEDWQDKKSGKVYRQLKVSENANVEFMDEHKEQHKAHANENKSPAPAKSSHADETRVSIERQVALKAAVDLSTAGDNLEKIVGMAEVFYKFLSNGQG